MKELSLKELSAIHGGFVHIIIQEVCMAAVFSLGDFPSFAVGGIALYATLQAKKANTILPT